MPSPKTESNAYQHVDFQYSQQRTIAPSESSSWTNPSPASTRFPPVTASSSSTTSRSSLNSFVPGAAQGNWKVPTTDVSSVPSASPLAYLTQSSSAQKPQLRVDPPPSAHLTKQPVVLQLTPQSSKRAQPITQPPSSVSGTGDYMMRERGERDQNDDRGGGVHGGVYNANEDSPEYGGFHGFEERLKGKERASGERAGDGGVSGSAHSGSSSQTVVKRVGGARTQGACEACKNSKVRCDLTTARAQGFADRPTTCRRCFLNNIECRVPGRKVKKPPPSHQELERRLHQQNEDIIRLITVITSSTPSPQQTLNPYGTPYYANPLGNLSDPDRLDRILRIPVWDKNLPKPEQEQNVEKCISLIMSRIAKISVGQDPLLDNGDGDETSSFSNSTKGKQREDIYGGDAKPQWKLEYEAAESEDLEADEGDKGAAGDNEHCSKVIREAAYLPDEEKKTRRRHSPDILRKEIVTLETCRELFNIFFENINTFFSTCDPAIHTMENVLRTSSFLFTTICAVSARHYTKNLDLYPILFQEAKLLAGRSLNGPKTVETCQAYMLLGIYSPPSRNFAEDRNYLLFGMAIRIATDLELHRVRHTYPPPPDMPEAEARALLNRGRVWINCFCTDRSISTQLGRPMAILFTSTTAGAGSNPLPIDPVTWWRCSPYNIPQDFHLCAYASLLKVMSGFHSLVYSDANREASKKLLDLNEIQTYADRLAAVETEWLQLMSQYFPLRQNHVLEWRDKLWPFLTSYCRLVVLSIGLRDGIRQGMREGNPFSDQCIDTASNVLTQVLDHMAPLGCMRFCPEAYFVFTGFAAAFLLKSLRPKFSFMMRPGREQEIITLLQRLIDLLDKVAIDNRHTPKLYARFLAGLLEDHIQGRNGVSTTSGASPHKQAPYISAPIQVDPAPIADTTVPYQYPSNTFPAEQNLQQYNNWTTSMPSLLPPFSQPQMPQSQFPSPSFPFPDLPQVPQGPMDLDENMVRPNLTDSYQEHYFTAPAPTTDGSSSTLFSMRAIDDVFFSEEGAMPGYGWTATPFSNYWNPSPGQSTFDQSTRGRQMNTGIPMTGVEAGMYQGN